MSVGAYGTNISVNIGDGNIPKMVDIYYSFEENRTYDSLSVKRYKKLDSSVLTRAKSDDGSTDGIVEGLYTLQLPLNEFNKKGFYTVYIKPREYETRILEIGNLTAFPDVRGIVLDTSDPNLANIVDQIKTNGIIGYRIIYFSDSGSRESKYRIVTSSNQVEKIVQVPNSSSDKSFTYRYCDYSNLAFLTVTPSAAPSFNASALPSLGNATQKIALVNTLFEPIMIDIEMTTHDADTISYMLESSQLRDLDNGLVTTYNDRDEIYHQTEHYTLKRSESGEPVYEVKKKREGNIDFSQSITDK